LIRITIGAVVRKEFRHPDTAHRVTKLVNIYELLKTRQVPNVDTLRSAKFFGHAGTEEIFPHVHLSPVGWDVIPDSGSESLNAIVCVLQALKARHGVFALVI